MHICVKLQIYVNQWSSVYKHIFLHLCACMYINKMVGFLSFVFGPWLPGRLSQKRKRSLLSLAFPPWPWQLDGNQSGTSTGKPPIFYRKKHRFLYTPMRKATTDFVRRVSCSVAQDSRMIKLNKHLESFRDEFHQLVYSWAHHIQAFIGDLLHKRNRRTAEEPKFALNSRLLHAWTNFGMFTTFCTFWFIRAISLHTLLKC